MLMEFCTAAKYSDNIAMIGTHAWSIGMVGNPTKSHHADILFFVTGWKSLNGALLERTREAHQQHTAREQTQPLHVSI